MSIAVNLLKLKPKTNAYCMESKGVQEFTPGDIAASLSGLSDAAYSLVRYLWLNEEHAKNQLKEHLTMEVLICAKENKWRCANTIGDIEKLVELAVDGIDRHKSCKHCMGEGEVNQTKYYSIPSNAENKAAASELVKMINRSDIHITDGKHVHYEKIYDETRQEYKLIAHRVFDKTKVVKCEHCFGSGKAMKSSSDYARIFKVKKVSFLQNWEEKLCYIFSIIGGLEDDINRHLKSKLKNNKKRLDLG